MADPSDPSPPPAAFPLEELRPRLRASGERYLEFFRCPPMSAGLYALPPGGTDPQTPHGEDEVYYVIRGHGTLQVGGRELPVTPGTTAFVPKRVEHRFHSFPEGLELLVVFAPAEQPPPPDPPPAGAPPTPPGGPRRRGPPKSI